MATPGERTRLPPGSVLGGCLAWGWGSPGAQGSSGTCSPSQGWGWLKALATRDLQRPLRITAFDNTQDQHFGEP